MPLLKEKYKTSMSAADKTALLKKIKRLSTVKKLRFNVQRGFQRWRGEKLSSFTLDETLATGTIVMNAGSFYGTVAAALVNQGLTYTAKLQASGFYANDVKIQLVNPGAASALSVAVNNREIIVTLAHSGAAITSTAADVSAAIVASSAANALVAMSGTGAIALSAMALTALAGGSNVQTYDKADILTIRRLRTKKWLIVLTPTANYA
jgi:anti-sigma factor RsiW